MSVLAPGIHVWLWPRDGWAKVPVSQVAANLVAWGCAGIIPQASLSSPDWCSHVQAVFQSAGLQVTAGLGLDGQHSEREIEDAIVAGIDTCAAVMLDEESPKLWETKSGNLFAEAIVKKVLSRRPNAADCVTDCPWWAPLKTPDGHDTHPHAPTAIFGRLAAHDRYAQVYGAPVPGASTRMLEWARDPSQYPSLGTWDIRPAFQGYHRTVADHVQSLVSEPTSALWDYQELDANCIAALKLVAKFRATTFVTIQDFQKAYGLVDDGIVGPATLAALAAL